MPEVNSQPMTALTPEAEALLAKVTNDWDFDGFGEYEAAERRLRSDLAAIEAAAARRERERWTEERLAKALSGFEWGYWEDRLFHAPEDNIDLARAILAAMEADRG